MAQKFVSLEEAAKLIGVTKDRLNELREDGRVRAYRDGAGWKFRSEDVEKLVAEGIPGAEPSSSDLALEIEAEADAASTGPTSDIELDTGDLAPSAGASDLSLEDLDEPTVPVEVAGGGDDLPLAEGEEESESILLSETELGESTDRPPSTIIGKAEMAADLDLEIASESDAARQSDVKLAPTASNVYSSPQQESALDVEPPSLSDDFGSVPELEIDLEAESSRILSPEDVSKAKQAAEKTEKSSDVSDLELAASDSSAPESPSGVSEVLEGAASGGSGLTGLSALELEGDDEEVLGEGSDITLSSESSGINIISPSDSGLALDELSGAGSMGSPLDLGSAVDKEIALEPLEVEEGAKAAEGEEPFTLTPFAEEAAEEEEDSSQVIPLDEVSEEEAGALLGVAAGPAEGLPDEFATTAFGAAPSAETADVPFPMWIMALLTFNLLALALCGMMMFDMIRNIWSWDGVYTLNSTLLEALNPFLG